MATSVVTTSIVVQFGTDDGAAADRHLSAEIDDREDGFNKGVTSFKPGDSPYILIYSDAGMVLSILPSTGSMNSKGTTLVEFTEYATFANETEFELSKPPKGSVTLTHVAGRVGASASGQTVKLTGNPTGNFVSVYRCEYLAEARVYQLTGIPLTLGGETSFPVVVLIVGT